MDYFKSINGNLFCEGVALEELARQFGTPLYVYSKRSLTEKAQEFLKAFSFHPTQVCYAVKANDNLFLLKTLFQLGLGADVVSLGELERVLKAGVSPAKVVFSGVGKTYQEIDRAIEVGITSINVESQSELAVIQKIAEEKKKRISINLRVNPNIDVKTNPYIATGLYQTKFGIADEEVIEMLAPIRESSFVRVEGLACHIGSQILELKSFEAAVERLLFLASEVQKLGFSISRLDMGGGLGIPYKTTESVPSISEYAKALLKHLKKTHFKLFLEPGRSIVGEAGGLLTQVIHTKKNRERHFTIVDGAMNDLIRPSLYEAYHEIVPVRLKTANEVVTDIVGPVCETGDFLGLGRKISEPEVGDLLLVKTAGAYGAVMSSHYNSLLRIAEVLVSGKQVTLIRKRES
ncbi:MAG: diaminopimelate decarboxylase, partial [Deltaproteobacteria bacterium]